MNKTQKVTLCVVLLIVLLIAWGLFPLFFKWLMIGIGSKETALKDFGTFGDIYGSLNTLFTSATLIIVMYSAYLQRQANQDAREAMEKQLQQAKEDTENQLKQACEATEQQILNAQRLADIQLKQSMEVSTKQLELAQATHQEQLRESQHAIFTNTFYALLNLKENKFIGLEAVLSNGDIFKGNDIFILVSNEFEKASEEKWCEYTPTSEEIENLFDSILGVKNINSLNIIYSYFLIYESIYRLINDAKFLSNSEKEFYKQLISNSMRLHEQVSLFYISCYIERYQDFLSNSNMFGQFHSDFLTEIAIEYHKPDHFYGEDWLEIFNQTPT